MFSVVINVIFLLFHGALEVTIQGLVTMVIACGFARVLAYPHKLSLISISIGFFVGGHCFFKVTGILTQSWRYLSDLFISELGLDYLWAHYFQGFYIGLE